MAFVQGSGSSHGIYKGNKRPNQKECVLIIDHKTGEFRLEKLSSTIQLKKTRYPHLLFQFLTPFTRNKNYLDHNLDCDLDRDPEYVSFTWNIHCSQQQSASHCCSLTLFSHCYIAVYLISGLKLSRSQSRSSFTRYNLSRSRSLSRSRYE